MKTQKNLFLKEALFGLALIFLSSALLNAQFTNPGSTTSQTLEEVRTGSNIEYSLVGTHVVDEEYRWVVIGGTITSGGTVITIGADSSVIEWTANAHTIEVDWTADLTGDAIGSGSGDVFVQKRNSGNCPSAIQVLSMTQWNDPSATLVDPNLAICSGDSPGPSVTIDLSGAPDPVAGGFEVIYNITATNLTDGVGGSLDGTGLIATANGTTATINLPATIINTDVVSAQFKITLTSMHDDFDGNGTLGDTEFIVTVHPTPVTGDIISGSKLARRL